MYAKAAVSFFLTTAALFAAHIDCASVPTIGDMIALGDHGCHLDSPATGFIQRDFSYEAASTNGQPGPDAFSLPSSYFGGHIIRGLVVDPAATLTVTFGYTYDTGTDLLSQLSAALTSADLLPLGAQVRSELCIGSGFVGHFCNGTFSTMTSMANGTDSVLSHVFAVGPLSGELGFRQVLTLPGGTDGWDYSLQTSAVIARVPEPLPIGTVCFGLIGMLIIPRRRS